MTTARDIIEGALRKIHVLGRGQSLPADIAQDALDTLNALMASISADGGYVFTQARETFSLTSATSYTIGTGGDFNTERPSVIDSAFITFGDYDYPLSIVDVITYNNLSDKDTPAIPSMLYYDNNFPLGTLYLDTAPTDGVYTITLSTHKYLTAFANLSTVYSMPPEYERMLIFNLAIDLAPDFERDPSITVMRVAKQSKHTVLKANRRNNEYLSDARMGTSSLTRHNIFTGWFNR